MRRFAAEQEERAYGQQGGVPPPQQLPLSRELPPPARQHHPASGASTTVRSTERPTCPTRSASASILPGPSGTELPPEAACKKTTRFWAASSGNRSQALDRAGAVKKTAEQPLGISFRSLRHPLDQAGIHSGDDLFLDATSDDLNEAEDAPVDSSRELRTRCRALSLQRRIRHVPQSVCAVDCHNWPDYSRFAIRGTRRASR